MIENLVREELQKFLERNPQYDKMLKAHAASDAAKTHQQQGGQNAQQQQADKDKAFRKAQAGKSGARDIEFKEGKRK